VIDADDALGYVEVIPTNVYRSMEICHCGERPMSRLMFGQVEIIGKPLDG
jgi:hypothetical protein